VVTEVSDRALKKLKFSELLPPDLADRPIAARAADYDGVAAVARRSISGPL
jgi:ATP-dependent Lhr-like helicase